MNVFLTVCTGALWWCSVQDISALCCSRFRPSRLSTLQSFPSVHCVQLATGYPWGALPGLSLQRTSRMQCRYLPPLSLSLQRGTRIRWGLRPSLPAVGLGPGGQGRHKPAGSDWQSPCLCIRWGLPSVWVPEDSHPLVTNRLAVTGSPPVSVYGGASVGLGPGGQGRHRPAGSDWRSPCL